MSTALAVAGVTAVLRGLLEAWLADQDANAALGGANAEVTATAPDLIELSGPNAVPRLNPFLHQVTLNQGWRTMSIFPQPPGQACAALLHPSRSTFITSSRPTGLNRSRPRCSLAMACSCCTIQQW